MTNKELIRRNLGLTFDFVKYLISNPKKIEELPNNFELEFIEKDFIIEELKTKTNHKKKNNKIVRVKSTFEFVH